jgi:hypothetical protein
MVVVHGGVEQEVPILVGDPEFRQEELSPDLVEDQLGVAVGVVPSEPGECRHHDRECAPLHRPHHDRHLLHFELVGAGGHLLPRRDEREVDVHVHAVLGVLGVGRCAKPGDTDDERGDDLADVQ